MFCESEPWGDIILITRHNCPFFIFSMAPQRVQNLPLTVVQQRFLSLDVSSNISASQSTHAQTTVSSPKQNKPLHPPVQLVQPSWQKSNFDFCCLLAVWVRLCCRSEQLCGSFGSPCDRLDSRGLRIQITRIKVHRKTDLHPLWYSISF